MRSAVLVLIAVMATRAAADTNRCEISVTGESNASIKVDAPVGAAQGKLAASTDYWLSDAQIRMAISTLANLGGKKSPEDKQRKVDEAMKKDPRFMLLVISCLADEGGVILSASSGSKYADVPFRPATYAIVPTGRTKPGELTAMLHLSRGGKRESYSVSEPGKLFLTQFDRKGIAGTFSFKAEQRGKKRVAVTGTFHYHCTGEACQK